MTKFLFWLLLLANLLLLILFPSGFGQWDRAGHEPDRLNQQLHADRITLLPEEARDKLNAKANVNANAVPSCIEVGNFNKHTAMLFETQLARLKLTALPKKLSVEELGTYMVFLPPQKKGQAAANQRFAELRKLGFEDMHIIQEQSPRQWGLSLGIFSTKEAAQAQLEHAQRVGATDVRIEQYPMTSTRTAYHLLGLEPGPRKELDQILEKFTGVAVRDCE